MFPAYDSVLLETPASGLILVVVVVLTEAVAP